MGKPLKYTPESLQEAINTYFKDTDFEDWTVTGLALVVGSKQLLQDYQNRDGYKEIVTHAKLKVENSYELMLRKKSRAGDIFALKNMGWTDRQEINIDDQRGKLSEQFKRARVAANAATSNGAPAE